nr:hypothetical protein [Tanacetum cinerariifolium]
MRLQALVDKKKVIITEATIRDVVRLDDTKGVECLPNEEIFAELARMGGRHGMSLVPLWHMQSSAYPHVENLISPSDLSLHSTKYSSSALTQKVFANMRRVGADEVNVEDVSTAGVAVKGDDSTADDVVPTVVEEPSIPSLTPPNPPPQPSQDQPSTS